MSSHINLFRKTLRSIYFISEERITLHWNTQAVNLKKFYDCTNDNFNVKIVIVLLLFFLAQKLIVGTPIIYFWAQKKRKMVYFLV